MVALRSLRLEAILGTSLDELQYHHLETLATNHISEAFDLDFKETLYGGTETQKRDLATDVAALANTAGGVLILGIAEDRQSRAIAAPGVGSPRAREYVITGHPGRAVASTPVTAGQALARQLPGREVNTPEAVA